MASPEQIREAFRNKRGAQTPAVPKPATPAKVFPASFPLTEEEKRKAEQQSGELAVNVEVPKQKTVS